jgi:hypothetical protein
MIERMINRGREGGIEGETDEWIEGGIENEILDYEHSVSSVAEPKLFVSVSAPNFKKFRLRSRLRLRFQLFNYLFALLLN